MLHTRQIISKAVEANEFCEFTEKAAILNQELLTLNRFADKYTATIEELLALTDKYHHLKRKIKLNTRRLKIDSLKMKSAKS